MGNEQSQNGRGGYQIDEITYAKGGGILNAYMYAQVGNRVCQSKLIQYASREYHLCFQD